MVLIAFVCVTPVLIFRMILPRCRVFHFVFLKLSQNSTTRYTILGGKHNNGNHINKKLTLYRNLRMDVVVRRGGLRDAPDREYREVSILLGVIHADPQAHIHLRGGNADQITDQLPLPPRRASANTTLVRDMCPLTNGVTNFALSSGKLWAPRGRGQ